ncbi:DUF5703 domain-containing protein [Candidatus Flexifilum breve]|uniref:DUF5703 domain-containing protein n=1 Tax=Candidatus Flexifilum breve TaxID=3140694 RepID=UPI003312FF09
MRERSAGRYVDTDFVGYQFQSPQPTSAQKLQITLYTAQTNTLEAWISALRALDHEATEDDHAREAALAWWQAYRARSHIVINGATPDETGCYVANRAQLSTVPLPARVQLRGIPDQVQRWALHV